MVSLTVTSLSEKILISTKCKHGFMSNTIKKSWTVSNLHLLHCTDTLLWSLEFILASTISAILLLADDGIYHYKVKCYIGQGFLRFVNLKVFYVCYELHIISQYRLIIFRNFHLFTIQSRYLTDFSTCRFLFKFFYKRVNKEISINQTKKSF